jgi:hypothetical protein
MVAYCSKDASRILVKSFWLKNNNIKKSMQSTWTTNPITKAWVKSKKACATKLKNRQGVQPTYYDLNMKSVVDTLHVKL